VARWYFPERALVDPTGTVHRPGCEKIVDPALGTWVEAKEEIVRCAGPSECWTCEPKMEVRLGIGDPDAPPREIP
jgi:hypothetical protein